MEKKYIIKLEENEIAYKTVNSNGCPMIGLLHPVPYTEPDMEQVRKEAYQQGLSDAWEAARTLWNTPNRKKIFGHTIFNTVLTTLTAQETIEKIRQYEQEKEEFHVGDEFENGSGQKFVVLKMDGKEIDRYIDGDGRTYVMDAKYSVMRKTGRSFPEIATVLDKMREGQEQ